MKTYIQLVSLLVIGSILCISCETTYDNDFPMTASLKVVHAAEGLPSVHVDYFGFSETIDYASNPTLRFGRSERYTLPANETRSIIFVSSEDTTSTILSQTVKLPAGNVSSLYLTGANNKVEALLVEEIFTNYKDSIVGIRFANLSMDTPATSVVISGQTGDVVSALSYKDFSEYIQFPAKTSDGSYTFEFQDASGNTLEIFTLDPLRRRREVVFKNLTLALVGLADDGNGGSTLDIIQINNY